MRTKKELEKELSFMRNVALILVAIILMILIVGFRAFIYETPGLDEQDSFRHAYSTANANITIDELDPDCIIAIDDFTVIGGSKWLHIKPECANLESVVYVRD